MLLPYEKLFPLTTSRLWRKYVISKVSLTSLDCLSLLSDTISLDLRLRAPATSANAVAVYPAKLENAKRTPAFARINITTL